MVSRKKKVFKRKKPPVNQRAETTPGMRMVWWGKHKGKRFHEVPTEYLEWFSANAYHQMVDRKQWADEELARRTAEPTP